MKTISTKRRYNFISIITFLVIALSFGYYYLIFVKNAENRFHDRAYRIIESVGKSIEKKQTNYHKIAQNALSFVSKYDHNIKTILHDNLQWEFYNDDYITSIPKLDSILKQKYGVPEELEFLYTYDFLEKFYFDSPDINKPDLGDSKTDILTLIGDYILFYISIDESIVYVKYHKEKLFNNTLRYDLFEEYFAFYEDSMIYDFAEKKDILVNLKLLYSESSTSIISPTTYGKYDSIIYNSQLLLKTSLLESKGGFTKDLTYLTPIDLNINRKAYLGGIINRDEFSKQTMRLNPIATTIFIVIMVLMIVMIPIIKIRLLSENERLNTSDSVLGFFAIVVSSAFIFMLILHQYSKKQTSEAFKQSILRTTAKDVEDLLIGEFDEILGNMEVLDSYENIDTNKRDLLFKYDNHSENLLPDTNLITLTWINAGGDQLVKWREGIITPRVNVSHRTYFKKPFQKKTWSDNSIANGTGFFIESILSITDGDHYLVFGKQSQVDSSFADINPEFDKYLVSVKYKNNQPSTIPSVVTLAVKRLKTFTNKYSPENLHLMLIDKSGDIIYHENKSKILQENLLTETQNNPNLLTALQNHSVNFFYSKYEVQDSYFHIRPVGSLPIYLVAYIDNDYEKTVSTQIFSLSSTLYFLLLFFIIFQVALFVLVDARWTIKTRGGNILFGWFWPNPHMNFVYKKLIIYNSISLILYLALGIYDNIFATLLFFTIVFNSNIIILNGDKFRRLTSKFSLHLIYLIIIILIILSLTYTTFFENRFGSGIIIGTLIILGLSLYIIFHTTKGNTLPAEPFRQLYYNLHIFLIILSLGIFPAIGFFVKSFNLEKELYLRNLQSLLFEKVATNKLVTNNIPYPFSDEMQNSSEKLNILQIDNGATYFDNEILNDYEYYLVDKLRINLGQDYHNSSNLQFIQGNLVNNCRWNSNEVLTLLQNDQKSVNILSKRIKLKLFSNWLSTQKNTALFISFFIMSVSVILLIFFIVSYWIRKNFLLNLPHIQQFNPFDIADSCQYVYFISPPYSGIADRLRERYSQKYSTIIKIKDIEVDEKIEDSFEEIKSKNFKTIIIQDSESHTTDALEIKTKLISKLKSMANRNEIEKIFIISSTQPSFRLKVLYKENGEEEDAQKNKICIDNYLHTIGKFKRVYYPIQNLESRINSSSTDIFYNPEIINQKAAKKWMKMQEKLAYEDRILNEQSLFQVYYFSIWHSLEDREKYLLYDLAQDGLANYRNIDIINDLIYKGILTYKNLRLELFSASFKNFILSNIDRSESLHIELEAKQNGNWANLRLPLLMIIIALFVFLLLTQQDKINSIFGWIATSMASLPILMRVLAGVTGIFSGKGK